MGRRDPSVATGWFRGRSAPTAGGRRGRIVSARGRSRRAGRPGGSARACRCADAPRARYSAPSLRGPGAAPDRW
jgi:hypothetical protein